MEPANHNNPDVAALIQAVLNRALDVLIERYGRERAVVEWVELVVECDAGGCLPGAEDLEADVLIALGDPEPSERSEPPPSNLSGDLHVLYWAIKDAAIHRLLVERLGYDDAPAIHMFDRFETRRAVTGGMGMVIEAYDPKLERMVAIKLWIDAAPVAQAALLAEAKTLAHLRHPNIVTVYDAGRWNDRVFFVMEWIEGMDGHRWLREPRAWREVLDVFLAAGEGLAAAHAANIQHRDFKPGNILIPAKGEVVVADFGVADSLDALDDDDDDDDDDDLSDDLTDDELEALREIGDVKLARIVELAKRIGLDAGPIVVVGTRCYVAPERLRGGPGDARSDQFSFCVSLWEALHGCRPYAGRSRTDVLESIECAEIRTGPQTHQVPHGLSRMVRKGLSEDPDQRYATMRELLQALRGEPAESDLVEDPVARDDASPARDRGWLNTPRAAEPARPDERVTVTSQARPPASRRPSWAAWIAGVAGALVLGVVSTLAVFAPAETWRARDQEDVSKQQSETADPATEMPCTLADDDPLPVDPVVLEVCEMIDRDEFVEASTRWRRTSDQRVRAGRPVGADALIVARTFDARAKALPAGQPAATEAAGRARYWAGEAVAVLPKADPRQLEAQRLRDSSAD